MISRIISLFVALVLTSRVGAAEKVVLREQLKVGDTAGVSLQFKAHGDMRIPAGDKKGTILKFSAAGQLGFEEKLLATEDQSSGAVNRSLRCYHTASIESTVEEERNARELRE